MGRFLYTFRKLIHEKIKFFIKLGFFLDPHVFLTINRETIDWEAIVFLDLVFLGSGCLV
jgi:hypothetical protein